MKNYTKRLIAVAAITLFSANAAFGQWKFETVEDDFADHETRYGYIEQGTSQIGLKCQSGRYELVYVTSDRTVDAFTLGAIAAAGVTKLMFRTDKDRPETLTARLDLLVDGRLRAIGELSPKQVKSIETMKQNIAVQLSLEDIPSNQLKFTAKGSTAVVKRVSAGCEQVPPEMTKAKTTKLLFTMISILLPPLPVSMY
ncbi:hypothetical protein GGQ73_004433 [Rhizobium skierniewicense]|uniref:Uncharacterized protein n=1 Tax=Rhizobium skierniewicense TaxID=984260 RepID=A0A7W6CBK7_9HYPH|nr:hypothetical protein [Rhizobium skierniewicense]MBB3948446.1 hypothetical protein [Rhizobium skierniewicense]